MKGQALCDAFDATLASLDDFYTPDEACLWMLLPNRLLDGRTALECLQTDCLAKVEQVIEQLTAGAYV